MANVNGTAGPDLLTGTATDDVIQGFEGADTIDGLGGDDRVDYRQSPGPVIANFAAGTIQDGYGTTDSVRDIEMVTGSAANDSLIGGDPTNSSFEAFEGMAGADTMDGGAGSDRVQYQYSPAGVIVDLAAGTAEDGFGTSDVFFNMERVRGSQHADTLLGGGAANAGYEDFEGLGGADLIDGRNGYDEVNYQNAPAAIRFDFALGTVQDGYGSIDTVRGIEAVVGSRHDDTLLGGNPDLDSLEHFRGGVGDDWIDGGRGFDAVDYAFSSKAVDVDLVSGVAQDGLGGTDRLFGIEQVRGSVFDDTILGTAGSELIEGRAGSDRIDGGEGIDIALYRRSTAAVELDLVAGTAKDGLGGVDTLTSMENVIGSAFSDTLLGDDGANELFGYTPGFSEMVNPAADVGDWIDGRGGDDRLFGNPGDDTLFGGEGDDTIYGGRAADSLVGGSGADILSGDRENDTLEGGDGADAFQFAAGGGMDLVIDFTAGEDRLVLVGLGFADGEAALAAAADAEGGTVLSFPGEGEGVMLLGVAKSQLSAEDFMIV
ncbi:hypothetical protein STVA_22690 [Allostella vacuolata]|nr:hypothetical protein STVA_22690 [Stella vacuolata]